MKETARDRIEFLQREIINAVNQQYICSDADEIIKAFEGILKTLMKKKC